MGILVWQRGAPRVPQAQEGLIERVASGPPAGWTRPHGTAACTIPIDVVTQGICHEEIDRSARQELVRDFGVSLLPQVGSFQNSDIEMNPAGGVFAAGPFLIVPEFGALGFRKALAVVRTLVEHRLHANDEGPQGFISSLWGRQFCAASLCVKSSPRPRRHVAKRRTLPGELRMFA